jgi:hypothetical protein
MLNEIFLSLFAVTFLVAVVAFSAYGFLLYTLLKHRSEKFKTETVIDFLKFLWKLLVYYIRRALSGFFDIRVGQDLNFINTYDAEIKDAESNRERMISAYRLFSTAYILFFILLICEFNK